MISLSTAKQLKGAGLVWPAKNNDFFAIPDRGMDERVFVISDLMSYLDIFRGWPVVTFHGSAEWALDYILTTEVVWLPTDEQLRDVILDKLAEPNLILTYDRDQYRCQIKIDGQDHEFQAAIAGEVYGAALLHILEK